ncbi:MAG: alanine--tRNA ligase [Dehalococcoidia bacterium]
MNINEIREAYLTFFEEKEHLRVASSSLVPKSDPTLLLTSAGMVQFKRYFTGEAIPPNPRMTSCQKCFRVTDIDDVGDTRHLTFFEMLGNFSVGDYFKKEAIAWSWEFVTERLKMPPERLWVTIYKDDEEAFQYWQDIGFPKEKIKRFGDKENFWGPAGDSGPCGPCSELHYDFGEGIGCGKSDCGPNCECGRFVEIWNLVFTQYDQLKDGSRVPLPKPNIDTGMGLERTAAVMQGVTTVYKTDAFQPMIEHISKLAGKRYGENEENDRAIRILADHSRAITFLIADGVIPSNEGRGYVLRRVLRRAALFGRNLGLEELFLCNLATEVIKHMGAAYPELKREQKHILATIEAEESRFRETLNVGLNLLDSTIQNTFTRMLEDTEFKQAIKTMQSTTNGLVKGIQSLKIPEETFKVFETIKSRTDEFEKALQSLKIPEETLKSLEVLGQAMQPLSEEVRKSSEALEQAMQPLSEEVRKSSEALEQAMQPLSEEIRKSSEALEQAMQPLLKEFAAASDIMSKTLNASRITGSQLFKLYDTYGFPLDVTKEVADEHGLKVDMEGFEREMDKQREKARSAHKFKVDDKAAARVYTKENLPEVRFVGDDCSRLKHRSDILIMTAKGAKTAKLSQGDEGEIVLHETPFYGEMGGQVGDIGEIIGPHGRFIVEDTYHIGHELTVHHGKVKEGYITTEDTAEASVDEQRRRDIARNHTATHLLQAALRQVLGEHIRQSGSLVAPDYFRFDFTHQKALTRNELIKVQRIVNDFIRRDYKVTATNMHYKEAVDIGALAFFDEKYADEVRVMQVGKPSISTELCGGCHVSATGEIAFMCITGESSIGAGIRRIEAVTGRGAERYIESKQEMIDEIAAALKTKPADILNRISSLQKEIEAMRKKAASTEQQSLKGDAASLIDKIVDINGVRVLAARVDATDMDALRRMGDHIKEQAGSVLLVLAAEFDSQANFIAMATPDLVAKGQSAGHIIKHITQAAGGRGGGRAETGQGGCKDAAKIDEALKMVRELVTEHGHHRA